MGDTIRSAIAIVLLLAAAAGGYAYYEATRPCAEPIAYRVETFDSRFGVQKSDFIKNLARAADLWNTAAGRTLFTYAEEGGIPVRLVFDTRQETANFGVEIDRDQELYDVRKAELETRIVSFDQKLAAYNAEVEYWNMLGGAPPSKRIQLDATREALMTEQEAISDAIDALNADARVTNARVATYNEKVEEDFEAGIYHTGRGGTYIELYEFTSTTQLVRLASHEFGHALGLGHVENVDSIMYKKNTSNSVALSSEDVAALYKLCGSVLAR